jgi:hypothetical protein
MFESVKKVNHQYRGAAQNNSCGKYPQKVPIILRDEKIV